MFIECPECSARKFVIEEPPHGKKYYCRKCGIKFIVSVIEDKTEKKNWLMLRWNRPVQRAAVIAAILIFFVIAQGAPMVFANAENTLVNPLEGIATRLAEAPSKAVSLIEDIRRLVGSFERNIISTAVQSMMTVEDLREVPPVVIPTNDMAQFPSAEHPLFPEYVDKRYSQFQYTLDSNGTIDVDISSVTGSNLLTKAKQLLAEWTEDK